MPPLLANYLLVTAICLGGIGRQADGPADRYRLADLVPADALVAYMARPYGAPPGTSPAATGPAEDDVAPLPIASILAFLNASGLISDEGQVFADIVTALPLLGRFEHGIVLLDVSSRVVRTKTQPAATTGPNQVSLRLNHMQTAVILRTDGEQASVLRQLNRIVSRYTNTDIAELSSQTAADRPYQRLTDQRLPGWAVWEWGRLDDFFVVTFGAGSYEKIARTYGGHCERLSEDAWFQTATAKTQGDTAMAQWFIALSRLEERLRSVAGGRHSRVVRALEADGITHDLWTVGQVGREMTWYRCYRRNGTDVMHRYSDPQRDAALHRSIVPPQARHFGIIHVPIRWLVDNLPKAWVAAQSEGHDEKWRRIWRRLEQETGLNISGSLIDHLGENVVIFDYPPHPLDIPFALTVAFEIDNRQAVQAATDSLLTTWSRYLDERAERKKTSLVRVKVRHDADGVWYLQAGLLGPAMKVTDRYLVVSWSPQALRDALKHVEVADRRPPSPARND